jgi:predicted aspartyl protease
MTTISPQAFVIALFAICLTATGNAEQAASGGGTLKAFLAAHGFAGAPLERRFGNHLCVSALINNKRTGMMIDTGAPFTLISKDSVATLGLTVEKTKARVGGVFGWTSEHFGVSKINSLAMGNCTLTNVPVAIADESAMNYYSRLPHVDGLFGAREMAKFGGVIDCGHQMLYVSPSGPSSGTSQQLAAFLAARGFTRIPLRLSSHHFDVEAAINGHPTRLLVDTGAGTTLVSKEFAVQSGVVPAPLPIVSDAGDGREVRISAGYAKELSVGEFKITNPELEMAAVSKDMGTGLLGEEYLSFNFAVIDIGGMSLYLRHPDTR